MKKLVLILLSVISYASAWSQVTIDLNGNWSFWTPDTPKQQVSVPHTYNVMEGLEEYAGPASYQRTLPIGPELQGKQVRLCFNGVYHSATIYVNDQKVGDHLYAGYTPFSMDITRYLDLSRENVLRVDCDNSYSEENLPWNRKFDWANDGGIYRNVTLHITKRLSLRYVHVTPQIQLTDSSAWVRFDIKLHENKVRKADFVLKITENATGKVIYEGQKQLKTSKEGIFSCMIDCGKVKLWHFDDPNLYTFDVKVLDKQEVSDQQRERFGFRTFGIEGNRLVLNGESVRLPGIENMPGSNPDFGMAEDHAYMDKTLKLMKGLNCTFTRYHWAQDDYRLQLADSLGMLVQEELSWWQGPMNELTPSLRQTARRQLEELIEAHYNHPSIWGWGMSNEVRNNTAEIQQLAEFARQLDSTRLVTALCNRIWENLGSDPSLALDLPTWNEYVGTWHARHRDQLPGFFAQIEPVLQGRPLLISEAGLCEPAFTGGDARRVDEMIFHINEWKRHDFVCGYIYFCLEDYRTQMGEEGLGKERIRRHGICDKTLRPKASYYVLQQLMCPIEVSSVKPADQERQEGTLANLYDLEAKSRDAEVTLRVKADIPNYSIRNYRINFSNLQGQICSLQLPVLAPGQEITLVLKDINKGYHFSVVRQDGSAVLNY